MPKFAKKNSAGREGIDARPARASSHDEEVPVFPDAPRWLPRGEAWLALPRDAKDAVEETIMPLHRELVLAAPSSMERTAGETLVYAAWLEVLEQAELSKHLYRPRARDRFERMTLDGDADVDALVDRMLNIAHAKVAAGKFVMKAKARWQELDKDRLFRAFNSPEAMRNRAALVPTAESPADDASPCRTATESDRAATVRERPSSDCLLPSGDCLPRFTEAISDSAAPGGSRTRPQPHPAGQEAA